MSFFTKLKDAVSRFMCGRWGNDSLNRFLIGVWFLEAVLNLFFRSLILYGIGVLLCVMVFFRMLSKNLVKRRRENAAFYDLQTKLKKRFRHFFVRIRDRKTTRFFKCPHCKAPMRMPRKVGKFHITCQKCGKQFEKEFRK